MEILPRCSPCQGEPKEMKINPYRHVSTAMKKQRMWFMHFRNVQQFHKYGDRCLSSDFMTLRISPPFQTSSYTLTRKIKARRRWQCWCGQFGFAEIRYLWRIYIDYPISQVTLNAQQALQEFQQANRVVSTSVATHSQPRNRWSPHLYSVLLADLG